MVKRESFASLVFENIVGFVLLITFMIYIGIFTYVALNDYAFYEIDQVALSFNASGRIPPEVYPVIDSTFKVSVEYLNYLDYWFLYAFIGMVITMLYNSYHSKRMGYFSIFSFLTYGIMSVMFITDIFLVTSIWFKDLIESVIINFNVNLPFFTYYLDNLGVVNFIIILICLLLNFVDFELSKYNSRKKKELVEM